MMPEKNFHPLVDGVEGNRAVKCPAMYGICSHNNNFPTPKVNSGPIEKRWYLAFSKGMSEVSMTGDLK